MSLAWPTMITFSSSRDHAKQVNATIVSCYRAVEDRFLVEEAVRGIAKVHACMEWRIKTASVDVSSGPARDSSYTHALPSGGRGRCNCWAVTLSELKTASRGVKDKAEHGESVQWLQGVAMPTGRARFVDAKRRFSVCEDDQRDQTSLPARLGLSILRHTDSQDTGAFLGHLLCDTHQQPPQWRDQRATERQAFRLPCASGRLPYERLRSLQKPRMDLCFWATAL